MTDLPHLIDKYREQLANARRAHEPDHWPMTVAKDDLRELLRAAQARAQSDCDALDVARGIMRDDRDVLRELADR